MTLVHLGVTFWVRLIIHSLYSSSFLPSVPSVNNSVSKPWTRKNPQVHSSTWKQREFCSQHPSLGQSVSDVTVQHQASSSLLDKAACIMQARECGAKGKGPPTSGVCYVFQWSMYICWTNSGQTVSCSSRLRWPTFYTNGLECPALIRVCIYFYFLPPGQNYCAVNNGGCTHLCLATPAGRSCKCPDNAVGVGCVERDGGYWGTAGWALRVDTVWMFDRKLGALSITKL